MHLEEILERTLARAAADTSTAGAFLKCNRTKPRYAIGKNAETLSVHQLAPLDGIIDDYAGQDELWHGIPLLATEAARKDSFVINCSTSIRPVEALHHITASGFRHIISLPELVCAADGALPLPEFVDKQRREMEEHIGAWQAVYDVLADQISRKTLLDVLLFRLTADPAYMRDYSVRISEQYFEDFMDYRKEIFVDAGGFDGDTSEEFARRYPDYRKILLFEPSNHNMELARRRLATLRDITFFPIGLSNAAGRLSFDEGSGSASSISDSGGDEIVVNSLDSVVTEPVSFIKMDLEGWELPALEGASHHIRDDQPKLAIAAYHKASDLRCIYRLVESFGHDYRVYLRHYTQGWSETVLFFTSRS